MGVDAGRALDVLPVGKAEVLLKAGKAQSGQPRIAFLAFGSMVGPCLQAATQFNATVVNMRFIKPLDTALVVELAQDHDLLVTVEEHVVMGGAGSACAEALSAAAAPQTALLHLGLPDRFIDHGDHAKLLAMQGLDAQGIAQSVTMRLTQLLQSRGDKSRTAAAALTLVS
jgi:1-deoxy-D-xylulose-5-phosphate synthase